MTSILGILCLQTRSSCKSTPDSSLTRKGHVQYKVSNKALPHSTHPPWSHTSFLALFKEKRSQVCHKKSSFLSWIEGKLLLADVDRPAEISQFYNIINKDNILRFKIPMNNSILVEVLKCFNGLMDIVASLNLREISLVSESVKKRAISMLN